MKVAVLGTGNGACAIAFEWAQAGHDIFLFDFPQFDRQINAISEAGGIWAEGQMSGFQKVAYAGHNLETCLTDAELVFVVGPAYSTEPFGKACKPFFKHGQKYVICPASCMGAIVFKNALGLAIEDDSVTVCDTSTLPYAVRIVEPGKIEVYNHLRGGYRLATLPSSRSDEMYALLKTVHSGIEKAKNVLETCLQNCNPVLHPCITTLNAARIEGPDDFLFYEQGVTPGVGRLLKAIDMERVAIASALGVSVLDEPHLGLVQGYMTEATYDRGISEAPGFRGIMAQTTLDYRYYNEDAGFGLVLWLELAELVGLDVPNMRAMLQIVSTIAGRDYRKEKARSLETLGLKGYTASQLLAAI